MIELKSPFDAEKIKELKTAVPDILNFYRRYDNLLKAAKKMDYDSQIEIINKYNEYELMENELSYPKVIHALTGAVIAKKKFNITDSEILNAIRYHTLGNVKMSTLDKIIYIADLTSCDRIYKGVEILRDMAYNNIDKAILMSIENTLNYLEDKRIQPDVLKLKEML